MLHAINTTIVLCNYVFNISKLCSKLSRYVLTVPISVSLFATDCSVSDISGSSIDWHCWAFQRHPNMMFVVGMSRISDILPGENKLNFQERSKQTLCVLHHELQVLSGKKMFLSFDDIVPCDQSVIFRAEYSLLFIS